MNQSERSRYNENRNRRFRWSAGWKLIVTGALFFVALAGICMKWELSETGIVKGAMEEKKMSLAEKTVSQVVQTPVSTGNQGKPLDYYKNLYKKKKAVTVVSIKGASKKQLKRMFYQTKISGKVFKRMYGKSYKKGCTVPKSDLRYVRVLYYGFDKKTHIGELVVNRKIAKDICKIFYKLYSKKYPIEKMLLVDEYNAVDEDSMADNNTSCFNYRPVSGTTRLSRHSYGMAVDINPLYNPYLHTVNGKKVCEPAAGKKYLNRSKSFAHKIDKKDLCYKLFTKYGFTWGGNWKSVKDYQHFEKNL